MGLLADTYVGEYGEHQFKIIGKSGLFTATYQLYIDGKLTDEGNTNSRKDILLELHGLIQENNIDKAVIMRVEREFCSQSAKLIVNNIQLPLKKNRLIQGKCMDKEKIVAKIMAEVGEKMSLHLIHL